MNAYEILTSAWLRPVLWVVIQGVLILAAGLVVLVQWRRNETARRRLSADRETERLEAASRREQLEAQLAQSQKMDAVGRLAGGIAHDFNNILAVIINYAKFLKDDFGPTHRSYEDVDEIDKAARRGADLIRQLLAFSRKEIVQPEVLDLNEVIVGTERLLRRLVGEGIDVNFRYGLDAWATKADRGQIEQVLMNLAANSRDAIPDGGRITIDTSNVVADENLTNLNEGMRPGSYVCLTFADTGMGIPQEVLSHIFDPFFTTKERGKGTGLGLSTVYGIVKQSGGYISVDSGFGVGTTFRIYFSATDEPVSSEIVLEPARVLHDARETVLVVEDEEGVRNLMIRILERAGYRLLAATSAEDALDRFSPDDFELLLTDVIMSGRSGKWLSDQFAAAGGHFGTLFVSGYGFEAIAERGVLLDDLNLLSKPFSEDQLLAAVGDALDRKGLEVPVPSRAQMRVLLIDDDPVFREMMCLLLDERDEIAEVRAAGHSAEAIQMSRDLSPHVVLMDHVDPGVGSDLLEEIRATAPGARIVSVSGTPGPREGTDAHVVKSGQVLEDVMVAIAEVVGPSATVASNNGHRTEHVAATPNGRRKP